MAVLRTIVVTLQAVSAKRFDNCVKRVDEPSTTYGPKAWGLICRADVEMRTREFARIESRLERKHARNTASNTICSTVTGTASAVPELLSFRL